MKPRITIGIPTYNRSAFLSESLASALKQSFSNVEILVSDNASTDDTEEVVASMKDQRVRYVKQSSNQGGAQNIQNLLDMTTTEYFCLLQDDDMIFPDLIARACRALEENPDASWYASYAIFRNNIGFACNAGIYGAPFILDWSNSKYRKVDGNQMVPMCLFITPAIPPATVYKTDVFRKAYVFSRPYEYPLLAERILVAHASFGSKVIIDPYIGGWFRAHPNQASVLLLREDNPLQKDVFQKNWEIVHDLVSSIVAKNQDVVCKSFEEWIHEAPTGTATLWWQMVKQAMLTKIFSYTLKSKVIGVDRFVERVLDILLKRSGESPDPL